MAIHRAPDGRVRFPGRFDAPAPPGFERVELRTTAEKRTFERQMNKTEHRRWEQSQERQAEFFEARRKEQRSELFAQLRHLPPAARDLAMAAIERTNKRPSKRYDAGFHMEALEMDASNREPCTDPLARGKLGSRK